MPLKPQPCTLLSGKDENDRKKSYLKCDCEGAEWLIRPCELEDVRRIEMEIHLPPISGPPDPALLAYISRFYDFEIERKPCHDILGVMGVIHAERR